MKNNTINSEIRPTSSTLTLADRFGHFLARWGYRRTEHSISPGLYSLGSPDQRSPVFVTANYTLSFDSLRSALRGVDCYILVLNTYGINVWCAAGKGTFGTDELVERIETSGLDKVVTHRKLILPQLGAAGVSAFEVAKRTGFYVEYGPVRAEDLQEYLKAGKATQEMRTARFNLIDRLVLVPVEIVHALLPTIVAAIALYIISGPVASFGAVAAILAGIALLPLMLPWLPTKDFCTKGLILGLLVSLPFAAIAYDSSVAADWWLKGSYALVYLLAMPPVTAYLALNFTGSTPFTSRTGVRKEIFTYIPYMAGMFATGILLFIALASLKLLGVI